MVSFQCDGCSDVVKKPKLDQHGARCQASFTCIDCSKTFYKPAEWKGHTTCISEAEKYQKGLYKGPKGKQPNGHAGNKSQAQKAAASPISEPVAPLSPQKSEEAAPHEPEKVTDGNEKKEKKRKSTGAVASQNSEDERPSKKLKVYMDKFASDEAQEAPAPANGEDTAGMSEKKKKKSKMEKKAKETQEKGVVDKDAGVEMVSTKQDGVTGTQDSAKRKKKRKLQATEEQKVEESRDASADKKKEKKNKDKKGKGEVNGTSDGPDVQGDVLPLQEGDKKKSKKDKKSKKEKALEA